MPALNRLPFVALVLLMASTGQAQLEPVPPPPGATQPEVARAQFTQPAPMPDYPGIGNGRLRLSVGTTVLAFEGNGARGFEQLENVGLDKPRLALRANFELTWRLGEVVRLGAAAGIDWTRQSDDDDELPLRAEARETALLGGHAEGVLVLGVARQRGAALTIDMGLRLAAGGGVMSWRYEGETEVGGAYRVSGAFDLAFLFGRSSGSGIGLRVGFSHVRSSPLGPLDLRFDLSGPFFDLGFAHGW